jgi:hypothetical protein
MLIFPTLESQAIVQLPTRCTTTVRIAEARTVSNQSHSYVDAAHRYKVWSLEFRHLSDIERATLTNFYSAVEGRLRTFRFLSPFENLHRHSDFTLTHWAADPQLVIQSGETDVVGGHFAVRLSNPTPSSGRLVQLLDAPGWFRYTSSLYVRGSQQLGCRLYAASGGASTAVQVLGGMEWSRASLTFSDLSLSESLQAGIEIGPLTEVYVCGPQLEVSSAPTMYKQTDHRSGIYSHCRFGNDTLTWESEAVNSHATQCEIMTRI